MAEGAAQEQENAAIVLQAYDLLELSMTAPTGPDAIRDVRAELEVMPREQLLQVALAITVEATNVLTHSADRPRFLRRLQHFRLEARWRAS